MKLFLRDCMKGMGSLFVRLALVLVAGTALGAPLYAQMLPFHASSAMTTGFEERALRSFVIRTKLSGLRVDGKAVSDPLSREMRVTAVPIVIPYAVYRTVVPIVILPIVNKSLSMAAGGGRKNVTNEGPGDLTVLVKFAPLQWDRLNETRRLAFFGGVEFPTASSTSKDDEGNILPAALQVGTGAFEIPLGVSFTMQTPRRVGIVADFFYNVNTRGNAANGADTFTYDIALGASIYPRTYRTFKEKTLNVYLEVNGSHEMRAGDALFVSPGVQFLVRQNLLVEASVQTPVYQKFMGARPGIDYTVGTGFRWVLPF